MFQCRWLSDLPAHYQFTVRATDSLSSLPIQWPGYCSTDSLSRLYLDHKNPQHNNPVADYQRLQALPAICVTKYQSTVIYIHAITSIMSHQIPEEDIETESCSSTGTHETDDLDCLHARPLVPSPSVLPIDLNSLPEFRPLESPAHPNWILFEDLRTESVVVRVNGILVHDYWAPIAPLRDMMIRVLLQALNVLITVRIRENWRSGFTLESDEEIMRFFYALRRLGTPLVNIPSVRSFQWYGNLFAVECGHGFMLLEVPIGPYM
ncbi:hypothetical protein BDV41DRAFT_335072 [Aspergillus transmontanensis]|uniref:Uncharacterized protein n=1 Tax=Aspergillus transmontanensis TaxID=1034304 RepID=A0A5N6VTS4_9EURO|nr:hypothetical protein BDV41DRAFT_335072 [Aspergillus transmontanensis]